VNGTYGYGTMWKKYGATALNKNEGITSASRTTPFGTVGPTRSKAAYSLASPLSQRVDTLRTMT